MFKTILPTFEPMATSGIEISNQVTKNYGKYHSKQIVTNRFTHQAFIHALNKFEDSKQLVIREIGVSEEGRSIRSINFGKGKIKVLLWSQMHGNESTATRAILDILNFLTADDEFNSFREKIAEKLTLQFIPMLNPDGTQRFQRRTALGIDINRDAIQKQTPEGRLLLETVKEFKPQYGFNLHDQRRFYNVKNTNIPSSISFLAPAFNEARAINNSRGNAMKLIAGMNRVLQGYIPGGVGLYNDTYSHRSFGDALQTMGISTILIESGWKKDDIEKESIRRLNFVALIRAFEILANKNLEQFSTKEYAEIPPIDTKIFDVLIKNVQISGKSNSIIDLGINRTEHLLEHPQFYCKGTIEDIGDLSTNSGFESINGKGLTVISGKTVSIKNLTEVSLLTVKRLLKQGVLFLVTTDIPLKDYVPFPINVVHPRKLESVRTLRFEDVANFLLVDKNQKIKYIILNGHLLDPKKIDGSVNGLVLV